MECVNNALSNAIYKLFRGNCPGQKSVVTCSGRNFLGETTIREMLFKGGLFCEKCQGDKNPGGDWPGGNFMTDNFPGRNYLGVIFRGARVRRVIVLVGT